MPVASLRLFVAVDLSNEVRDEIEKLSREVELALHSRNIRWVPSDKFHLTLKFIGTTAPDLLEPISKKIESITKDRTEFLMNVQGMGVFPGPARARILWVGIENREHQLSDVAGALDRELVELGIAPEARPYVPHLTIAKFQNPAHVDRMIEPYLQRQMGTVSVDRLRLYQSRLEGKGSVYELLREFHFVPARRTRV
ncbi:MAG: 2'-5' RNA ligase [Bdellovibrionales bacterium GWC1_52_8]|nr:MAG: 2'-5' RNA ligase [Bdellovibrionales bacterium GWA1_52_35]OFZ37691.1 MAG: 2'-5' RNA ligase [Bdellovibrionales bacterium GWC1_52_8]